MRQGSERTRPEWWPCSSRASTEGTAPVAARVSAGAEVPILDTVVIGLLVAGVILLALSTLVLVLAIRRRVPVTPAAPTPAPPPTSAPPTT